ncbi:MAG: GntR family transcriptional regulator, mannosyl-D-glycerate transport/metabolism system repressor [Eubacteriaceae bacterium]|jgi:GntR family transcriptional regulator|nr:GntR family transcriptional regulator, mannosyl-D-glycerate transport/metabolism system repressor [Eubacteriaceae bacterium]MDK2904789.1 GntR family transcriptional regulator, mannosyl-D-glycerate transport/metabolism system repressor [Eubacteriaceae bacterium]MDK2961704.1 GntR family transcriptional regulator, mannosyl-D-glycerate transport/metabolism system repressor [Eubacteriaceae bacterium]MDN5307123.1 GntR family transcriptional regulator, mannosyl-D-glycerate transport/metabolism syste
MSDVLYLAIVASLKEKILKSQLKPGDMLNSEAALMQEYSASRMTIRKSLSLLSNEGYIYSVPGKGNFVCKPEVDIFQFKFNKYDGLNIQIDQVKLLSVKVIFPDKQIDRILNLEQNQKVVEVKRLLFCDDKVIAMEIIYLPYVHHQPVIEDMLKFANYLKPLEEKLAFVLDKSLSITANTPSEEVGKMLDLSDCEPVFEIAELIRDEAADKIIQYAWFYVSTRYLTLKAETPKDSEDKRIF